MAYLFVIVKHFFSSTLRTHVPTVILSTLRYDRGCWAVEFHKNILDAVFCPERPLSALPFNAKIQHALEKSICTAVKP